MAGMCTDGKFSHFSVTDELLFFFFDFMTGHLYSLHSLSSLLVRKICVYCSNAWCLSHRARVNTQFFS